MADINFGAITEALNNKVDLPMGDSQDGIDFVVDWQDPTDANGHSWYRKYKSGWVEQGGFIARNAAEQNTITFSIPMANTNYSVSVTGDWTGKLAYAPVANKESATTTGISLTKDGTGMGLWWQVSGIAQE